MLLAQWSDLFSWNHQVSGSIPLVFCPGILGVLAWFFRALAWRLEVVAWFLWFLPSFCGFALALGVWALACLLTQWTDGGPPPCHFGAGARLPRQNGRPLQNWPDWVPTLALWGSQWADRGKTRPKPQKPSTNPKNQANTPTTKQKPQNQTKTPKSQ